MTGVGREAAGCRGAGWGVRWCVGWGLVVAVVVLAVVVPVVPAWAAGGGGDGAFGLTPAPGRDGRAAPYFALAVAAGHSAAGTAVISNLGQAAVKLKVSRSTGVTAANGGSAFSRSFQSCAGPGCWVRGLPRAVTLPVGSSERLAFTVRVPRGTPPGQYLAGITAQPAVRPRPVRVGSDGKATAKAVIIDQVTVGVAVTVGSRSRLRTRLVIPGVSGEAVGPAARLSIRVDNTGQTFAHAAGKASCVVAGTRHSFAVLAATVLPGEGAVIAVNAPGLPEGAAVPCTVRLRYGRGLAAAWAGPVTVPAPPHGRVIHVGPGTYAVVPASTIPPWAIALLVIGALILAAAAVLLIRTRSHTPAS